MGAFRKPGSKRKKALPESEAIKSLNQEIVQLRKEVRRFQNLYGALLFSYNTEISGHLISVARAQADLGENYALGYRHGQQAMQEVAQNLSTYTQLTSIEDSFERGHFAGMEEYRKLVSSAPILDPPRYEFRGENNPPPLPVPLFDYGERLAA
jgi:hypothetical protein